MMQAIIGKKQSQIQKFLENGTRLPVTVISVPDNVIVQIKTQEKDKYTAIQIGHGSMKKPTKTQKGHAVKAGLKIVPQILKEIRVNDSAELPNVGDMISIDKIFTPGDIVEVTGISKGKGFAGVVKRHHFRGGPKTHGQSDRLRAPGSIGQTTTPGRVYRGKKMAGRMGHEVVTIKNLKVIDIDPVNKLLYVSGLVPGGINTRLLINRTGKTWKQFSPLHKLKPEAPNQPEEVPQIVAADTSQVAEPKPVKAEEKKEIKDTKNDKKGVSAK